MNAVALRVAAGPGVGLGHAVRCQVLAEHLPGAIFVTGAKGVATLASLDIPLDRIEVIADGEPPEAWLLRRPEVRQVVFDTLQSGRAATTEQEVAAIARSGLSVTVIDSMPPDHFRGSGDPSAQPDLVVTPYFGAERLRPAPKTRHWLSGAAWAVLPSKIRTARYLPFPLTPCILVTCGGADPSGLSARISGILSNGSAPVEVILGPDFTDDLVTRLEIQAEGNGMMRLHRNVTDMLPHYLQATVIVGRPGLQRYEAAALGRTGIYFWEGADYVPYFRDFAANDLAEFYFGVDPDGAARFSQRLAELTEDATLRQVSQPNRAALAAIDGTGAEALAAVVLGAKSGSGV